MKNVLPSLFTKNDCKEFKEFTSGLFSQEKTFFLRNDIVYIFRRYCDDHKKSKRFREQSSIFMFLKRIQELFISDESIYILHRYAIAKYRFYRLRIDGSYMEEINNSAYLDYKSQYVIGEKGADPHLHIDFMPFYDYVPSIRDTRTVGNGIRFLNRYMCSHLFSNPTKWNRKLFEFIQLHKHNGRQLLVNGSLITDFKNFYKGLEEMLEWLRTKNPATSFRAVEVRMKKAGFEAGWGNTVGIITETMQVLVDLINEPTDGLLEEFISRVPMPLIAKIAIISPHGWFAQSNVLGKPDTGGQVIYILDQVRALEKHIKEEIRMAGIDIQPKILVVTRLIPDAENTTCNQKKESIFDTENSWILRIPFRDKKFKVVRHWISRFEVWPYLEDFADDAATQMVSEFEGRPDLIIGNYSDGNLVAMLLSDKFDVVQCTIAHALEKTKYLFSDMYWKEKEKNYHFSQQFTADLLAMNKSDFIIASTHQEIIGTEDTMGQYESYQFFAMPGLYEVLNGINLFAPKFNVIPPGVDENLYFPYYEKEKRIETRTTLWTERLFHKNNKDIYGTLQDPDKPAIFTMARFDKIKNITGLIEAFGMSQKVREHFNLIFSAGSIHLEASKDPEEQEQIRKAYALIHNYELHHQLRWLPSINKLDTGEVYRIIADRKGIFVQPALFEAFGLTIIEAMLSGLPTFGPKFGGPLEIIEYGISGLLLNTSKPEFIAGSLENFIDDCQRDPKYWNELSKNGIRRVLKHFTWRLYSERLTNLTKLYGFWRYSVRREGKIQMDRYCDLIYHFLMRERARAMQLSG